MSDGFITYDESVGAFINERDIYDKTPEILSDVGMQSKRLTREMTLKA